MPIDVYTAATPNGIKVPIALEELGVPYRILRVDLAAREQKAPDFLRLNPNGRIPVIVDPAGPGGTPLSVFESGAILLYLAERFAGLLPDDPVERVRALEYTMLQVGGVGPMFGQAGWFARNASGSPAFVRFRDESIRLTGVLELRLRSHPWLAGTSHSIADIMNFGWLDRAEYAGVSLREHPAVEEWVQRMRARPAVQRAFAALA